MVITARANPIHTEEPLNLIRKYLRPEVDHLVADFTKLEAKLAQVAKRHLGRLADLTVDKQLIEAEIAHVKDEVARAERISKKIIDLVE